MHIRYGNVSVDATDIDDYISTFLMSWSTDEDVDMKDYLPPELFDEYVFAQYALFISLEDFDMNDRVAEAFNFLGYINENNYPVEYWKCKLHDDLVRKRFYKNKLYDQGFTVGLADVTDMFSKDIMEKLSLLHIPDGTVLAGGIFASFLCPDPPQVHMGIVDDNSVGGILEIINDLYPTGDMDLFLLSTVNITGTVDEIIDRYGLTNSTVVNTGKAVTITCDPLKPIQIIKRVYRTPAEIVLSFDIDASGFVYWHGKIYSTYCARYAGTYKVNMYDESRAGIHYAKRLNKYTVKGYRIEIPQLDRRMIDFEYLSVINYCVRYACNIDMNLIRTLVLTYFPHFYVKTALPSGSEYETEDTGGKLFSVDTLEGIGPEIERGPSITSLSCIGKVYDSNPITYIRSKNVFVLTGKYVHVSIQTVNITIKFDYEDIYTFVTEIEGVLYSLVKDEWRRYLAPIDVSELIATAKEKPVVVLASSHRTGIYSGIAKDNFLVFNIYTCLEVI